MRGREVIPREDSTQLLILHEERKGVVVNAKTQRNRLHLAYYWKRRQGPSRSETLYHLVTEITPFGDYKHVLMNKKSGRGRPDGKEDRTPLPLDDLRLHSTGDFNETSVDEAAGPQANSKTSG
ncbi:unnamed protein product [Cuscuta campestris]|uniref:Uncharacterized protein n=1 Tax=Cuscuta campestris TaxID=132261 RepID=A0A484K7G8_9ASTE|nr:unnamed protein product [Cuscuta campestris]